VTSLLESLPEPAVAAAPSPVTPPPVESGAFTVAVTGGCGGAGASVLAAALARTAAAQLPTLLIDADRLGGGADLLLGAEHEPGLRWPQLALARGALMPGSLTEVLPLIDGVRVLAWDREPSPPAVSAETVTAVVSAARREAGLVVIDLPRLLEPPVRIAAEAADLTLLVVPATVHAVASARRSLEALTTCPDVRLVVRSGYLPTDQVVAALGRPLAGVLRPEPDLDEALRRGEPPGIRRRGPLTRFCRSFLTVGSA
jgi:secretion/DNA translocation related CpaE-like protein